MRARKLLEPKARPSPSTVETYPFVEWSRLYEFLRFNWQQGEHVAIVGPTGSGKTTLESEILKIRNYVVILVTKVYDDTFKLFPDYEIITKWPRPKPKQNQNKLLLWPTAGRKGILRRDTTSIRDVVLLQRAVFKDALDRIFKDRGWTVVFDEQHYLCQKLKLEPENSMYLHQGRSSGLTVVNGTQRPAWVPVVTYSSSTHAFIWNTNYRDDLSRLSDLGGINSKELAYNIQRLGKHEFIYVNTRTGDVMRSQVRR